MKAFIKGLFMDGGQPSSSRVTMLLHSVVACVGFLYVVFKNHAMPDGTALSGLGAFVAAPYALNTVRNILQKSDPTPPEGQ